MSRRLYLGRLPHDVRSDEVQKFFDGYGRIVDCRVMTGFGFIEFESSRDAEEVVRNFNGKTFMGSAIMVEFAKESRSRREPMDDRGPMGPPRVRRPPGVRVIVSGISRDTSWQDLKDFGREAGSVSFADIDRDVPGQGILEYLSREDAEHAIKALDNKELRGQAVRVALDSDRGPIDNFRREDRRDDRYRDERYRDDREYRAPPRDDRYRRDRSRSPGRRPPPADYERDHRRPRSPPPPSRYEDRRPEYEDRRGGEPYDRRRDDRREDRRTDDRARNGDSGWSSSRGSRDYREYREYRDWD